MCHTVILQCKNSKSCDRSVRGSFNKRVGGEMGIPRPLNWNRVNRSKYEEGLKFVRMSMPGSGRLLWDAGFAF